MQELSAQLELLGFDETVRRAEATASTEAARRRVRQRIETMHEVMSALPEGEDLGFQHAGLCQTFLPHSRPKSATDIWKRKSGDFTLSVSPGAVKGQWVGVPYGAKARLILIHLQTEGVKSRTVHLGENLSAFLRSLGLARTGGERGTITMVRQQTIRLLRCKFTMEWEGVAKGWRGVGIQDIPISNKQMLWTGEGEDWTATLELTEEFHAHLKEHAVPLDKRGIAHLAGNSLGLDLYALFAYRLPQLKQSTHIRWTSLKNQIGSEYKCPYDLAKRVRAVIPDVLVAYPHAKIEATTTGLTLRPSEPSVPAKTRVAGLKLVGS
jgi:hypothetical protein